jgi:hypothetical protein
MTIDLSKYAAGKKLRCVDASSFTRLTIGKVYESLGVTYEGTRSPNVRIVEDDGEQSNRLVSRFVPVEDEAPESNWYEVGRNRNSIMWRRRDTKAVCFSMDLSAGPPSESTSGYDDSDGLAHLGKVGYSAVSGKKIGGYEPPDVLSPGHAIREPVRLNEAQREAARTHAGPTAAEVREAYIKPDPYALNVAELESKLRSHNRYQPGMSLDAMCAASMVIEDNTRDEWKQAQTGERQLSPRERLIAALRRELDDGSRMKAFPKEGRLCRVYKENDL